MGRILTADDDKLIHLIYSKIITALGHEVKKCHNGEDAVKAVETETFDLIILDNMMPKGMNGYEACQAIRQLPNGITVPIIIVSADDSQDSILKFLAAGANDYLLKPISEPVLVAKLKNFLKTSSLHKSEFEMVREHATIADRYKIQKVLGYGAHSVVFLADDLEKKKNVAVKFLNKQAFSSKLIKPITELVRKLKEAKLENVIKVYDFGQYSENIYIVLEYAEDGDLAAMLKQQGRLDEQTIIKAGFDISHALLSMHHHNILHLDLKPENIMIDKGIYKLSDFGIVTKNASTTMALNSEIWGTPAYSSPEALIDNGNISVRSDIYSLGIILYEGLTGDNPFLADKPAVSMFRQLNLSPPPLLGMCGLFSVELSVLIDSMLAKEPELRPGPDELVQCFRYMVKCLENNAKNKLTYLEKTAMSLEDTKSFGHPTEQKETINEAIDNFSKAAKVDLPAKTKPAPGQKAKPVVSFSRRSTGGRLKSMALKAITALIVFFAIYALTVLIVSAFSGSDKSVYDFNGIPSVVECESCGDIEVKPVINIDDCHCEKCGGHEWFALRCRKCGKIFPLNENILAEKEAALGDDATEEDNLIKCPFCGSSDYLEIEPEDLDKGEKK